MKTSRIDPFSAPKWMWPMLLAAMSLRLGVVIAQALDGGSLPMGLKVVVGAVQFVSFLAVPLAAGAWWGRGRPGGQPK